jgi:hypothetical protein
VVALGEVNVQSLSQSLRAQAFRVYSALIIDSPVARSALGGLEEADSGTSSSSSSAAAAAPSAEEEKATLAFLESVLDAVDGEKDPRGLSLSLPLIKALLTFFPNHIYQ